jgi:hypothetical protein
MRLLKLPAEDLSKLPSPVRQLVHDYFAEGTGGYMIPDDSGAFVDLDTPNPRYIAASETFRTTRRISVGEELTIDYRTYTTIRVSASA